MRTSTKQYRFKVTHQYNSPHSKQEYFIEVTAMDEKEAFAQIGELYPDHKNTSWEMQGQVPQVRRRIIAEKIQSLPYAVALRLCADCNELSEKEADETKEIFGFKNRKDAEGFISDVIEQYGEGHYQFARIYPKLELAWEGSPEHTH